MANRYLHTEDEVGEITERALIEAFRSIQPPWLWKIERATPELDIRGIDTIAVLQFRNGRVGKIPLQIKSSLEQREEYFYKNHWAKIYDVICLVIKPSYHPVTIRYHALMELKKKYEAGLCMGMVIERRLEGTDGLKNKPLYQKILNVRQLSITNKYKIEEPLSWYETEIERLSIL